MTTFTTLDDYTFDLRSGLRDAAKAGLSQLEEMLGTIGYSWLDDHMEDIMDRATSRAPMAELMKTPSRTQTVKKTRAMTTAMKDRTDKINRINSNLGSPVGKGSPHRAPLSPLQPRAMNNVQMLSPSPIKAKPLTPAKSPLRKQATPSKKGTPRGGRNLAVPSNENVRSGGELDGDVTMLSPTPRKPTSKSAPQFPPIAFALPLKDNNSVDSAAGPAIQAHPSTLPVPGPSLSKASEAGGADVFETTSTIQTATAQVPQPVTSTATPAMGTESDLAVKVVHAPIQTGPAQFSTEEVEPKANSAPTQRVDRDITDNAQPSSNPVRPTFVASSSTNNVQRVNPAPVRQVRSSWLHKAMGNGTVPITDMSGVRQSYAGPSGRPTTGPLDFAALRKSLAPVGGISGGAGIKRPSEGADEDEDDEDKRPEKIFKVDQRARSTEVEQVKTIAQSTSANPDQTDLTKSTKSTVVAEADIPPADLAKSQARPLVDNTLPNQPIVETQIHKVSKALDDLQKRAAQKEAHRQKAALSASNGPRQTTSSSHENGQVTAAPVQSGFLKNLGNIGIGLGRSLGLGGTVKNAEEEALRLREELEEEQRAELEAKAELERLMNATGETSRVEPAEGDAEDNVMVVEEQEKEEVERMDEDEKVAEKADQQDEESVADALDAEPMEDKDEVIQVASTTPVRAAQPATESTTPMFSPPRRAFNPVFSQPTFVPPPQASRPTFSQVIEPIRPISSVSKLSGPPPRVPAVVDLIQLEREETEDDEEEEEENLPELPEPNEADDENTDTEAEEEVEGEEEAREVPAKKMFKSDTDVLNRPKMPLHSANSLQTLAQSTTSQSGGLLSQASIIAGKTLGFKPTVGTVKSVQLASVAAKKEQNQRERRLQLKEQADQRKAEAARQKAQEERTKLEEDRKARAAEVEEKRRLRLEADKKRREKEEKNLAVAREKALKEEAEKVAARAKVEEENKKRKLAQAALNKSSGPAFKKIGPAPGTLGLQSKPKEPLRSIKPVITPSITLNNDNAAAGASKLGPTSFRTAETTTTTTVTATHGTMSLVQPRAPLGPPSRPSSQLPTTHAYPSFQPQLHGQHGASSQPKPLVVLQQSRVQLQTQLDEKALEMQSEDIVLPDIASEYSDSDDSDKEDDFKPPQWAESPNLRTALEAQANVNPDGIFGPIKPLNMEELFKQRTSKFRARTSSANWGGGDRLTIAEEVEYAKRMGFKG